MLKSLFSSLSTALSQREGKVNANHIASEPLPLRRLYTYHRTGKQFDPFASQPYLNLALYPEGAFAMSMYSVLAKCAGKGGISPRKEVDGVKIIQELLGLEGQSNDVFRLAQEYFFTKPEEIDLNASFKADLLELTCSGTELINLDSPSTYEYMFNNFPHLFEGNVHWSGFARDYVCTLRSTDGYYYSTGDTVNTPKARQLYEDTFGIAYSREETQEFYQQRLLGLSPHARAAFWVK